MRFGTVVTAQGSWFECAVPLREIDIYRPDLDAMFACIADQLRGGDQPV